MKLLEILNIKKYKTDKHTTHQYVQEYYETAFVPYKDKPISLLEIGVLHGESLKLWYDYFSSAEIYGIDIFTRVSYDTVVNNVKNLDVKLHKVDSFNENEYAVNSRERYFESLGTTKFDIIIDDGLHTAESQFKTFNNFKPYMNKGGTYVIEDIRDTSVQHLSQIDNIKFLHLTDNGHPKGKQYIAEIKF